MKSALVALRTGIQELRGHIKATEIEWDLLAASSASPPCSASDGIAVRLRQHVGQGVAKRRFDYNCIIISLYGLLEQYVEALVVAYGDTLNEIVPRYEDLPVAIKERHIGLTLTLIQQAGQSRYRGVIDAAALVANLHSCLNNQTEYKLNTAAFCSHEANFRAASIDGLFTRVGVQGVIKRLHQFSPFTEYLEQRFPDRELAKLAEPEMVFWLEDLAERRNEVAHGAVSQLLSNEMLLEYVEYVEALCGGLYAVLYGEVSGFWCRYKAVELGSPINVFNHAIVCIELRNVPISVGDTLIASTGNPGRPYLAGQIEELQMERVSVVSVAASPSVQVGIRVGFKAKQNYKYSVVPTARVERARSVAVEAQDESG